MPVASVFLFFSAAFSAGLACYAFSQRRDAFSRYFIVLMAVATLYAFGYGAELMATDLDTMKRMLRIQYLGIPFLSLAWLGLAWSYLDSRGLPRRVFAGLLAASLAVFVIFQTNDWHRLFYVDLDYRVVEGMAIAHARRGPLYWLHIAYLNLAIGVGVVLFFRAWQQSMRIYHWQSLCVVVGSLFPWSFHLIYLTGYSPYQLDLGPFGLAAAGLFFTLASFWHRIFDVLPVARDLVFDNLSEGVIVIDARGQVSDFNPAAARFVPGLSVSAIGRPLDEADGGGEIADWLRDQEGLPAGRRAQQTELALVRGGESLCLELRRSPMVDRKGVVQSHALLLLDVTEKKRLIEQLHRQATVDVLTGIANRRHVSDLAQRAVQLARRNGETLSVAVVDVDDFKTINDRFGHDAGDRVLREVAQAFRRRLRATDIFGRFGGDEFVVVLPGSDAATAAAVMSGLCQGALSHGSVTLSVGIAELSATHADFGEVLRAADRALYQAKRAGKGQVGQVGQAEPIGQDAGAMPIA